MKRFIQHPIFTISGAILIALILLATALRAWDINIPAVFVFSYSGLIVIPVVALIYFLFKEDK
jgi:hypothetical protein